MCGHPPSIKPLTFNVQAPKFLLDSPGPYMSLEPLQEERGEIRATCFRAIPLSICSDCLCLTGVWV